MAPMLKLVKKAKHQMEKGTVKVRAKPWVKQASVEYIVVILGKYLVMIVSSRSSLDTFLGSLPIPYTTRVTSTSSKVCYFKL